MKIQGIYKIRNCINNKIYIGQSIDIEYRFWCHKNTAKLNYKYSLYRSIRKYGIENFEFTIIEMVTDSLKLDEREQYWLDYYQSYIPEFGYNICAFARSTKGRKVSDETKLKISVANKGCKRTEEFKRKVSLFHKGRRNTEAIKLKMSQAHKGLIHKKGHKHSEETRLKLSLANKGKKHSEETKRKLSEINKGKSSWMKGKHHTEETKLKMSLANKGKKHSEEYKRNLSKKMKQVLLNKKLVRKRLTLEDIQKFEQNNIIQFKQAM